MDSITINNPLDMHIHLREGEILESVINYTSSAFCAALAMPNLKEPIINTNMALEYKNKILKANKNKSFTPIMSLYLTHKLDKNELLLAKQNNINILKLYPKGSTTGSENGVDNILDSKTLEIFEIAQNLGFILSIHGESNGFCIDREFEFGVVFERIAKYFPKLKIIMEHLSDRRSIDILEKYDNLFATLTLHHICFDLNSLLGGNLNPHYFCKPIIKTPKDKEALLNLALNAHKKVSFGSDSAPHLKSSKLNNGSAGIFSAPILLSKLCEIFEKHNKLENLQSFISDNAFKNYALKNLPNKKVTLIKKDSSAINEVFIESEYITVLFGGEALKWQIE
ncbi:dihydroorotase [Helicobacter sp. MIT 14-3879]|uniref:dihydroorotase n=1 Tax=Helicobacter sp. MIT 14-3879 TaxID=2040649 RepID=UPI000E1ECB5A|nr:dihydroorotase [Helicobacter sp. MIT 14-3879]RDU62266.1 dihydroorotase [Helicobacter sp. MIT 14-3879]